MPATQAIAAFGTLVKWDNGAGVYTTIAELRDISGPNFKLDTKEVTSHSSPGAIKEFIATLIDAGEITFNISFLPQDPTHDYSAGILRDMFNRTRRNVRLVFPDAGVTTWTFPCFVVDFKTDEKVDGSLDGSVTVKVAGQPTLA